MFREDINTLLMKQFGSAAAAVFLLLRKNFKVSISTIICYSTLTDQPPMRYCSVPIFICIRDKTDGGVWTHL